ncbi:MAG: PQQ-dependent sugar dehydrogenase [Verrucomicrobiales bacterium]|nr:PQQ-dependent sugar dehydrogenase [Verrucomicrobiales bacterium]
MSFAHLLAIAALLFPGLNTADEIFEPDRLTPTTLATGLNRPMELEVAPDGRVFFIELDGRLRIFHPKTQKITEAGTLEVTTQQENGLIGIALDPDFANNQHIFLQYSPPDFSGQHVSRFTMKGDTLDLASEKRLLKFEEQRLQCCHHAGSLEFGPDGCLFIATGDNTHPGGDSKGFAPIDERPDRMPWDAQKSASNKFSYNGKVLRIKPKSDGTYEVPDGNLFPKDGSEGIPEIYVMGCRNPWRISVDQKSGYLYWGEVGPDAGAPGDRGPAGHDEINQARKAGNFGWPYFVGPNLAYPDVNFETGEIGKTQSPDAPVNDSPNSTGVQTLPPAQPAFVYYHRNQTEDFPMLRTGGRTACAGPVYHYDESLESPTKFPKHFDNTLFIYEWSRHWIFGVKLDAESNIDSLEELMPDYGFVRPIDMDFGPEGSLYLIEYGETWGVNADCKLIRVDYIRGNRPPKIKLTAAGTAGRPPLKVAFSSEGTVDPDGDALTYEWKIVPGTEEAKDTSANPTLTFDTMGSYQAVLTVTDAHGARATASTPVLVGNEPPIVDFKSPQDGDFYDFDTPITWDIAVVDPEDGNPVPERVKIFHQLVPGDFKNTEASLTGAETLHPGLELMKKSDCFNCHVVDRKLVGPSFFDVAAKYKDQKHALDEVAKRIVTGSSGIWGEIPMIPHPQHGIEQSRQMAEWIFSLSDKDSSSVLSGLSGEFQIGKPKKQAKQKGPGVLIVEATYLDGGAPPIAPLSGTKSIRLRHSTLLPGDADAFEKLSLSGTKAGSIMDQGWIKFAGVNLSDRTKASVTYASGGPGGTIEIRHASVDGELLGSVKAEPTGDWNKRKTLKFDLKPAPARGDLYIRFSNPGKAHLMNLESISFIKRSQTANE